ncbi:MAG TPA: hypothetical protein VFG99_05535, partial [Chloroflexia bacterium]|nr:hypothetical protein [Chloroflexia bacterium]
MWRHRHRQAYLPATCDRHLCSMTNTPEELARSAPQRVASALPKGVAGPLQRVRALAEERGWSAYLVGGFVRDALLGIPQKDVDLTVVGDGVALAHLLASEL